jgi:abortive infection bacteriophage resistance protein
LGILISRGLVVGNQAEAISKLQSISYYRLSGYSYPFRIRNANGEVQDNLIAGTTLEQVIQLYEFDRHLRLLILDAIERVEVAIRTQLTYNFSCAYGPFGHIDAKNFHPSFKHAIWLADVDKETLRSGDEFIRHYSQKYDGFPIIPLWMLTEVMSLGGLSHLYRGLNHNDKRPISGYFNIHYKRLESWLHALTYIRNVCAHHSRLWNRELSIRPDLVKDPQWQPPVTPRNDRIFFILLILRSLLLATGNGKEWKDQVNQLLTPIAESKQWRIAMGMPDNWKKHPIWSL